MTARVRAAALLVGLALVPLSAQDANPEKSYEDVRFKIWFMDWRRGEPPVPALRHDAGAAVVVFIDDGTLRLPSGKTEAHKNGDFVLVEKGSVSTAGELVAGSRLRALIVEVKDLPPSRPPDIANFPSAFPRPGVTTLFENPMMRVSDVWFVPSQPLPAHYYPKNTVLVWLSDGTVERAHPGETPRRQTMAPRGWEMFHGGVVTSERAIGAMVHMLAIEHQ